MRGVEAPVAKLREDSKESEVSATLLYIRLAKFPQLLFDDRIGTANSCGCQPISQVRKSMFKPFYDWLKGKDLGVTSWPPDGWKTG
jgi:hypothetical protein